MTQVAPFTHCVVALLKIADGVQRKELGRQAFSNGTNPSAQTSTREEVRKKYLYEKLSVAVFGQDLEGQEAVELSS